MKKRMMLSLLLLMITILSSCTDGSPAKKAGDHYGKKDREKTKTTTQEVIFAHLKIKVSSGWGVKKGLDSASFSINGNPAGMVDGLAYADSVEALLPNQSIVTDKLKLTQLPFEAYLVSVTRDTIQSKPKKETHLYLFVEPKLEVYDFHFDVNEVDEQTLQQIVKSAEVY